MLRGMQGCSERQARGLAAAGGYASVNISPLRFMGCCQLWHRGCSNPSPPELVASRQRESFPWKKIFSEGSQKEIPKQSCQDPHPLERCLYVLPSKPESSWLTVFPPALQGELRRKRLWGCWMNSALGGWMSGGRALQPPTSSPPHSPALKHHPGALSLPFSRWFRITFHLDSGRYSAWLSPGDET